MKKVITLILALLLLGSLSVGAFAATGNSSQSQTVSYSNNAGSSYTVTVPAKIDLTAAGGSGEVSVKGNWAANETLTVTCPAEVTLTNNIVTTETQPVSVSLGSENAGITQTGNNASESTASATLIVGEVKDALFGVWTGTVEFTVALESKIFNFTIVGTTYQAENGMTWEQWVESSYNTAGYHCSEFDCAEMMPFHDVVYTDGIVTSDSTKGEGLAVGCYDINGRSRNVTSEEVIDANIAYWLGMYD